MRVPVIFFLSEAGRYVAPKDQLDRVLPVGYRSSIKAPIEPGHSLEAWTRLYSEVFPAIEQRRVRQTAERAWRLVHVEGIPLLDDRLRTCYEILCRKTKEHLIGEEFPRPSSADYDWWTRGEVARMLGVSVQAVSKIAKERGWRLRSGGGGRGKHVFYMAVDVAEFIGEREERENWQKKRSEMLPRKAVVL